MRRIVLASLFISFSYSLIAQTGPGGVGNADGSSGQPQNVLWLRSNTGISTTGALVDSWTDQSGNSNSATGSGATRPSLIAADANFNGLPSINFLNTGGVNFFLQVPDNDNLDNTSNLSIFFVARPNAQQSGINGIISKRSAAATNQSYFIQLTAAVNPAWQTTVGTTGPLALHTGNTGTAQIDIISQIINGTSVIGLRDGTAQSTTAGPASIANNNSNLFIGSFDAGVLTNFEGQMTEVIIYRTTLNQAQRIIVENYLSSKYNTALSANDNYGGDVAGGTTLNHDFDLAGIGFSGGTSHFLGNSQGFILSPSGGTVDVNGEFVLAAHNGVANAVSVSNLGTGGVVQRWDRTWYVDKTGTVDANITFDFSEGIAGQFPQNKDNYVLLRRNTGTGNYDVVATIANSDKTLIGDQIS
ncbi:MAG TPA: hypothetical protein PLJ60_21175, partial [Chryseolinea sp.]|nr:hypothetical protein [Chryseolinea sp.]